MLSFGKKELDLETGRKKEWIITNGLGSYSSSTIIGLNTRRYHGLLITALKTPGKRTLALAKIEETLNINDEEFSLGVNQYPNTIFPQGYKYLENFVYNVFPSFHYKIKDVEVTKSIVMPHGHNLVVIRYLFNSKKECSFTTRPFVNLRDFHSLNHEAKQGIFTQIANEASVVVKNLNNVNAAIILGCDKGKYLQKEFWVYNVEYQEEKERGYDFRENHYSPGEFKFEVKKGISYFDILCVADKKEEAYVNFENFYSRNSEDYKKLFDSEILRVNYTIKRCYEFNKIKEDWLLHHLIQSADNFIVKRDNLRSVIAGYHWFSDYGRDAMVSLTGLCLVTGKIQDAKDILLLYKKHMKNGLIPVLINEDGVAEYRSVDTSLWFIYSCYKFYKYTRNLDFVKDNLWNSMKEIISSYKNGTEYYIKVDSDGLVENKSNLALTWMDTQYTIRNGKNVEVNALWYNCLKIMEFFSGKFSENSIDYVVMAKKCKKSFEKQFWIKNYLADTINGNNKDISVRPNQIFAISLPFRLLDKEKELLILKKITEELLTPYGLRSLTPRDNRFIGKYEGDASKRDKAYHNGTVWGWLLGQYLSAYIRLHGHSELAKKEAKEKILKYVEHSIKDYGVGTINEIYDGNYPFTPRGCISQAWSVAEILRSYVEDVLKK